MVRKWKNDGSGLIARGYGVASKSTGANRTDRYGAPWVNPSETALLFPAPGGSGIATGEDSCAFPYKFYLFLAEVTFDEPVGGVFRSTLKLVTSLKGSRVREGSTITIPAVDGVTIGAITATDTPWTIAGFSTPSGTTTIYLLYRLMKALDSTPYGNQETGNRFYFDWPNVGGGTTRLDDVVADYASCLTLAQTITPPTGWLGVTDWTDPSPLIALGPNPWRRIGALTYPGSVVAGDAFDVTFETRDARTGALASIPGGAPDPVSIYGHPQTNTSNAYYASDWASMTETSTGVWDVPGVKIFLAGVHRIGAGIPYNVAAVGANERYYVMEVPTLGDAITVTPAAPSKMRLAAGSRSAGSSPITGDRPRIYRPGGFSDVAEHWNRLQLTAVNSDGNLVTSVVTNSFVAVRLQDPYDNDCGDECPDTPVTVELVDLDPTSTAVPGRLLGVPPTPGLDVHTTTSAGALIDRGKESEISYGAAASGKLAHVAFGGPAVGPDTFEAHVTFQLGDTWPLDGKVQIDFPPLSGSGASVAAFVSATGANGGFSIAAQTASSVTLLRDGSGTNTAAGATVELVLSPVGLPATPSFSVIAKKGLAIFDNIRVFGLSYNFLLRFSSPGLTGFDTPVVPNVVLEVSAPAACETGETITITVRLVDYGRNLISDARLYDKIFCSPGSTGFVPAHTSVRPTHGVATFTGSFPGAGTFRLFFQSGTDNYGDMGWYTHDIVVTDPP